MNAAAEPESYEEERRLLYVAVTRCRKNLWLTKPEVVAARFGGVGEMSPLLRDVASFDRLVESSTWTQSREDPGAGEPGRGSEGGRSSNADAVVLSNINSRSPSPSERPGVYQLARVAGWSGRGRSASRLARVM